MKRQELVEQIDAQQLEVKKKPNTFMMLLKWVGRNLKFILVPGAKIESLTFREKEYEKLISKRKFIRRLKSILTLIGIGIIFVVVTFAIFPDWISYYSRDELTAFLTGSYGAPSPAHPLGQTEAGRDVLGRMIFGAQDSITIALPAILIAVGLGTVVGVVAAYYGGWIDSVLMRLMDIFLAFPGLILVLVFISIWGRRMEYFIGAYGVLGIAGYARLIRGSVLQARELPYVVAARVSGAGNWKIMFRHILPNTIQPIIISFTFDIGGIILSLAGLSYLGFGDPRLIEWGNDISNARAMVYSAPWAAFWPGMMIIFTVLGFMLTGDGLRDAFDPRLRNI
jgi:peptide/nickel transport system permease protein